MSARVSVAVPDSNTRTLLFAFASSRASVMPAGPEPITKQSNGWLGAALEMNIYRKIYTMPAAAGWVSVRF